MGTIRQGRCGDKVRCVGGASITSGWLSQAQKQFPEKNASLACRRTARLNAQQSSIRKLEVAPNPNASSVPCDA
eukprot:CAMPEP_0198315718 /NCGR_PEP_ID=MMETSP1450-20131203/5887_1 /TAXON_ID=753684 ORGANISM="Madagascaria erythrocladiodes, Strain CCMP3234" /NCGR_SAMPLE_ID=MMETSP1450 /ASSEMBLY_ACC=CAM_ASM_001115 /LENGTH=73 /DNA_ID=CAMNT_0044018843 /DNA_START=12 /DNA_END=233 /DNA_ORIENTATION=-